MTTLDVNLIAYLSPKGISEDEFRRLEVSEKVTLINAYENSIRGK